MTCLNTAALKAEISCKYGDIATKWAKVVDYYDTKFFPYQLTRKEFQVEFPNGWLNPNPVTESITFNQFDAKIEYNASYNDKKLIHPELISLESSATLTPSLVVHASHTAAFHPREHNVQDLRNATRTKLSVDVTAIGKPNQHLNVVRKAVEEQIDLIKYNYIGTKPSLLEDRNLTIDNTTKKVQLMEVYTYEGDIVE